MNILSGIRFFESSRKEKAAGIQALATETAVLGVVATISEIIEHGKAFHSTKMLKTSFAAISKAVDALRKQKDLVLTEKEDESVGFVRHLVAQGVKGAAKLAAAFVGTSLAGIMRLVAIPIFRVFSSAVVTVFRVALTNPLAASAAVVAGAFGAWRLYQYSKETATTEPKVAGTERSVSGPVTAELPDSKGKSIRQIVIDAAIRNGVPVELALKIGGVESNFDASAAAGTSSAKGLFQIVDKTWAMLGGTPGKQSDPVENANLGTKYIRMGIDKLKATLGRDPSYGEVYAMHFLGHGASAMFANMPNPKAPVSVALSKFLTRSQVRDYLAANRNVFYKGKVEKTVGEFLDWLNRKMGTGVATTDNVVSQSAPMPQSGSVAPSTAKPPPEVVAGLAQSVQMVAPQSGPSLQPGRDYIRKDKKIIAINGS